MKAILTFVLAAFIGVVNAQQFQTDDPGEYSNYMVNEQIKLAEKVIRLTQVRSSSTDPNQVNQARNAVIAQLDASVKRFENMAPLGGKTDYRDEVIALFKRYKEVYVTSYVELTNLMANKNSSIADLEKYMLAQEKVDKELNKLEKEVSSRQERFAKEHNMQMTENRLAKKMAKIAEANNYSSMIFMEYIKLAKENEKFMNANTAQDVEAMKKARADMIKAAPPVVRRMETFAGHEGSTSFRDAAVKLVQYYEKIAHNEFLEMTEFIAMTKTEPTSQEEVDKYNKGVERYNEIINSINADHTNLINQFNQKNMEMIHKATQD